jgi:hypothetical protein
VRLTLTRRHQGNTRLREEVLAKQQNINLQQEDNLVKYIELLTKRYLLPTQDII